MDRNRIKKAFSDEPEVLRLLEEQEQTQLLKEIANRKAIIGNIELIKGDKGDSITGPMGPSGAKGLDGTSGVDGRDGKDGRDGRDGKDGTDGKNGKDGKDTSSKEVIEAIKDLKGEASRDFGKKVGAQIDISDIRNAQSFMFNGKRIKFEELLHGGGTTSSGGGVTSIAATGNPALTGAVTLSQGSNITLTQVGQDIEISSTGSSGVQSVTGLNTDNADPANPIVKISVDGVTITGQGTPGSPLVASSTGFQSATGVVNGINTIFTFATAPNAISVDGVSLQKVSSDGNVNWTGTTTITLTVAPNLDIFGLA